MNKEINIGDLGVFSGRVDKKVKVIRVDEKYVTYLIIDENKKKYIYLEDFKKKFKKEGDSIVEKGESKIESKIRNIAEEKKTKKASKPAYTIVGVINDENTGKIEETEDLEKKGIAGYRIKKNTGLDMYFGYIAFNLNQLDEAKKRLQDANEKAEREKEFQKVRDAENKIKREENKILEQAKLEAANKEIIAKPAYLMTLVEYQDKVIPILQEYQKFLRKNSQYFESADFDGIYQYTYPELEEDFENKTVKGWKFQPRQYRENPLADFKASHYPTDDIVETNKSFVNKLKNYFTEKEIYSEISKDEFKSNKRAVKRAIDNDTYKKLLESGKLTESELETIAKSVDVSVPKKVFSVQNVKAKEMKAKFEKLLVDLPTINKEQLDKLIESIKIDFKPLENEVFEKEKERYSGIFENLTKKERVYEEELNKTIVIWQELFTYQNKGVDKIKTGRYYDRFNKQEIIESKNYYIGLKLKPNWEDTFDKFLKEYVDTLKYSFIDAIIKNFTRITKPIEEFEKLRIRKGDKGFEGVYRFTFDDGSYFDFKAEAIRAGGYNIQVLHLRYITNFENITLADGSKVTGYANLIENFNVKRMEHGGLIAPNGKKSNLTEKQYNLVRTPEFKAWFGDWENDPQNASKVVDENGEPLVVYHSTPHQFNVFKMIRDVGGGDFLIGSHFGTKGQAVDRSKIMEGLYIKEFFLKIKNLKKINDQETWYPSDWERVLKLDINIEDDMEGVKKIYNALNQSNIDGFVYLNDYEDVENKSYSYIVLEPNQIKLADGTNTTFDMNNPDIRYNDGGLTITDMKNKTDKYKEVLKKPSNLLKISQMHKVPVEFLQSQLVKGIKVESEHTNREAVAKIIALHHLEEDPRYYLKLEKMEGNKMADGGMTYDERELKYKEEQYKLAELSNAVLKAQRDIAYASDADEAIQNFYDARNVYRAFEQSIFDREDSERRNRNINNRIEAEIEHFDKYGEWYEHKELFKKSPALAALQSAKDMVDYVNSDDYRNELIKEGVDEEKLQDRINKRIKSYQQDVKDLEYHIGLKKSKSKKLEKGGEINIGDKVTINKNYGGGSGVVKDIIGSFVVVKTQDGDNSYHYSNLTLQNDEYEDYEENYKKGGELDPDDENVKFVMTHKAGSAGGLLVGKRHSEGGIKAINKSTNSPIEMEGGEVVITRNAVSDNSKREFEGQMLTNREILSKINESGGGVSFASGGSVPSSCKCSGKSYKYGGEMISDYDIVKRINSKY